MTTGANITLALDLGGTRIKGALVAGARVLAAESLSADSAAGLEAQLPRLTELLERLSAGIDRQSGSIRGVGLAVPCLVDPVAGQIRAAPPGKYGDACRVDLHGWARDKLGLALRIENDAHAALLGEWRYGAGQCSEDLVMLTIGTGIGCSVLIRGRPLRGKHFQAGVLGGHLIARPQGGADCKVCRASGCYEAEAASLSLARQAMADPRFNASALAGEPVLGFEAVFRHAAAGDAVATAIRDRCVSYWTALLVSLVHAYDPDRIVIGGAMSEHPDVRAQLAFIEEQVNRQAWITEPVTLVPAALGNHAGVIGAAALFDKELACI